MRCSAAQAGHAYGFPCGSDSCLEIVEIVILAENYFEGTLLDCECET